MIALSVLRRSPECPHEVACEVTVDAAPPRRLWFRVEGCEASALRDDRSDGVVLQFLLKALTEGHDISFVTPMSHQLWYALTEIVLPTLCREVPDYRLPRLLGPTTDERAAEGCATATSVSGGVDSFYTILRHRDDPRLGALTHLLCFDIGAFEGHGTEAEAEEERDLTFRNAEGIARELGLPLVKLTSNLPKLWFHEHTANVVYANAGATLLLGGLVRRFFFPSAGTPFRRLQCYPLGSEYMASWLLPHLSCPETRLTPDDTSATRAEKVRAIARDPVVRRHLLLKPIPGDIPNDTRNYKCVHTLLMLEQLGPDILEGFKGRFDLALYARERHTLLRQVARKWLEGNCGQWVGVRKPVLEEMTLLDHLRLAPRWCRFLLHKLGVRRKRKRFDARPR